MISAANVVNVSTVANGQAKVHKEKEEDGDNTPENRFGGREARSIFSIRPTQLLRGEKNGETDKAVGESAIGSIQSRLRALWQGGEEWCL